MTVALVAAQQPLLLAIGLVTLAACAPTLIIVDVAIRRLPAALTLPQFVVGGVLLLVHAVIRADVGTASRAVAGALIVGGFYGAAAAVGAAAGETPSSAALSVSNLGWVGWLTPLLGIMAGLLLASASLIVPLLTGRLSWRARVPFGPFQLTGGLLAAVGAPLLPRMAQPAEPAMPPATGPERMGHAYVDVVEEVGADVRTVKPGDFVVGRSSPPTTPARSARSAATHVSDPTQAGEGTRVSTVDGLFGRPYPRTGASVTGWAEARGPP